MPSSRESSQPRDRTHNSDSPALAGGFFTTSTTWEAPVKKKHMNILSLSTLHILCFQQRMVITTIIHKVAWESLAFRLRALAFGDRNPGELSLPYLSPVWDTPLLSPLGMLYVFLLNEG